MTRLTKDELFEAQLLRTMGSAPYGGADMLKGIEDRIQCPTFVCSAEGDDLSSDASKLYDALTCDKRYCQFTAAEGAGQHCEGAPGPGSTPARSTGSARCSTARPGAGRTGRSAEVMHVTAWDLTDMERPGPGSRQPYKCWVRAEPR